MNNSYQCKYLTGHERRVFLSIADCIIPPDKESPGAGDMHTVGIADWALGRMPVDLRTRFLLFIMIVEIMGIFFGGKPFTKNSAKAKDRQLRWMESGPIRVFKMGFFGLKNYVCMGYYTRENIWQQIGYDGPGVPDQPYPDPVIRGICQGSVAIR